MIKRLYTHRNLLLIILLVIPFPRNSHAKSSDWQSDKARLEQYAGDNQCEKYWDILWPWAKAGNLEARSWLLFLMAPPPDMTSLFPPGNSGDLVTKIYDMTIMAVHSEGNLVTEEQKSVVENVYVMAGFNKTNKGQLFLECIADNKSKCSDLTVKEQLVPSFGNYASKVDRLFASGLKSTCARFDSDPFDRKNK